MVDETWGPGPRYNKVLVREHQRFCDECHDGVRCEYAELLHLWVTHGVDVRVLNTIPRPTSFARRRVIQAEREQLQLQHLEEGVRTGLVEECGRGDVRCVGNVFLVGTHERPSGLEGVEYLAKQGHVPEVSTAWEQCTRTSAKERLVMDMRSVNYHTNRWEMTYDSLLRVADRCEPGDILAVLDLSAAFHLIPLARPAWSQMGIRLKNRYWRCKRLTFGYSAAPAICSIFTGEIARLIEKKFPAVRAVCCYVDDFLMIIKAGADKALLAAITMYLQTMGAIVKPEKCQWGTEVTFTGFGVRVSRCGTEIVMREEKRARLLQEINCLRALVMIDTAGRLELALEKLCGRLQWYWPALCNSYAWLEPFHHWRRKPQNAAVADGAEKPRTTREALLQALDWWEDQVEGARGQWRAIGHTEYRELAMVDASGPHPDGTYSLGGVLLRRAGDVWSEVTRWRGVAGARAHSTQEAELEAILEGWRRMSSCAGIVVSDATAAVTAAAKGYTRAYGAPMNRRLRLAMEEPGVVRRVMWAPRTENTFADGLSRPQEKAS